MANYNDNISGGITDSSIMEYANSIRSSDLVSDAKNILAIEQQAEKSLLELREKNLKKIEELKKKQIEHDYNKQKNFEDELKEKRLEATEELYEARWQFEKEFYKDLDIEEKKYRAQKLREETRFQQQLVQKQIDALAKAGIDPKENSKRADKIREQVKTQEALERTARYAKEFTAGFAKLGEKGNIFSNFRDLKNTLSSFTTEDGRIRTKRDIKREIRDALAGGDAKKAADLKKEERTATINGWARATAILANIAEKLDATVEAIARNKSRVDTRLYGSKNKRLLGSYWSQIEYDTSAALLSPLIKQEDLVNNILKFVDMGIARDIEQMGMLETIKDKIASTFNAFDGNMMRLIKIQDTNTTAARLGMEASLTELLNQMYETTEYLSGVASSVRSSLAEAEALMSGSQSVAFEYQVQKWLGSLYSVGVSQSGISSISSALGQLAAGQIEGLSSGGASNLLVMAANRAGLSLSDVLADGLDSSKTNLLLQEVVNYMNELVNQANGNLVVQQQLAKVFGLSASDLRAATNLTHAYNGVTGQMSYLSKVNPTYGSLLTTLYDRSNTMAARMNYGEFLTNMWSNLQYSTAAGMASNPILYATNKVAQILDSFAGGVPIPSATVMGTGVDTKLTVSNIMKSAAMVGGLTQSLASMIASIATGGGHGFSGSGLLNMVGLKSNVSRGAATSASGTATVMNANISDVTESATAESQTKANRTIQAAEEESTEVPNKVINENIVNIYTLLSNVIDGSSAFHIEVDRYNFSTDDGIRPSSAFNR